MRESSPFHLRARLLASLFQAAFLILLASQAMGQTARDDYRVGLTLYQQGHYAQAVAHFQSAAQADPSFWQAYQVLGQCKYQLGDKAGALSAFDQSLQIHPDNPTLRDFADKIRKAVSSTSSGNSASRPVSALGMSPRPLVNPASQMKPAFVQVYGTVGNSVLTDLTTGYRTINNLTSGPNSNNQSYFPYAGMGVEMGYCPDQNDCFSMNMELASVYGFSINNGDPTDEFIEKLSNQLLTLGVNYSYLTPGKDGPWIARFGVAYYLLGFSFYESEVYPGNYYQVNLPSGSGNGLGASVALGKDFDIGGLSLELLGKVKVGTISQMTGAYTTSGAPIQFLGSSGTGALAVGSDGSLNVIDQARLEASGDRYALMELLGYELRIGLNYSF